jgi:alpha-1,3-rhamnosyl/mannosyltransferase
VCGSEFTAAEIRLLLGVPDEKLVVTPYGVDPVFRETPSAAEVDSALRRQGLPRGAVLYVGSDEKRKNLALLAMAYMALSGRRRSLPPLVLVGPGSHWAQGGTISGPQIRATGYLPLPDLRALMAASALLVLPSLEEGFGLPVAEAMTAGLPVVCSRGSALEEVAGDAAYLVEPREARSIASGIERVLDDVALAESLREKGLARSARFDWDQAARETLAFYRKILGR